MIGSGFELKQDDKKIKWFTGGKYISFCPAARRPIRLALQILQGSSSLEHNTQEV